MPFPEEAGDTRWHGVLVRFGEIGIKSAPVRRAMVERLRQNLLGAMERVGVEGDVVQMGARLWMAGPDPPALAQVAARTFGVVSASPARRVPATPESLTSTAVELALSVPWRSFAIRARREGTHAFSSQDVQVQAGAAVLAAAQAAGREARVDLGDPDVVVDIDVRQDRAFLFLHTLEGPGGIPVGTQGKVLALLSDEASLVAAWMAMRRGCSVAALHAGGEASLPRAGAAALVRLGMEPEVSLLEARGPVAKEALLQASAVVAQQRRAIALVTGDGLGSRLLAAPLPVLRPVCGLDPGMYARIRDRSGIFAPPAAVESGGGPATAEALLARRRDVAP